ncbi:NupC/NupG family nucleoside CNT transporter [Parvularcula lutaonensis]|uniref:NupC/NupG family nucleoside CNT transporter n=1 Tax=Parvularcula lutaonensis TaxID=491923 RepID=A0ABV7M7B9_9PROT|nr:nucleoside transporter C-terminal domain-containing protein [Parvularcula lutaonensis]GGY41491.1 nucleoside:proton symporter [Parvularcula lutaonensis]
MVPELFLDPRWQSLIGFAVFSAIAWAFSERHLRLPPLRRFIAVFGFQVGFAAIFLRIPAARESLTGLNSVVGALRAAVESGTSFVFGYAGRSTGLPFPGAEDGGGLFFIFAFQALPLLVFVGALAAVLWHWGILKILVRGLAFTLTRLFGTGGSVSLAAAANVLLGQTEAPLLIRPMLARLTRSELHAVITCGFATVAGTVMALYAIILAPVGEAVLGHIIVAAIISVPAALLYAELMVPPAEGETPTRVDDEDDGEGFNYAGTMDAFTTGATEGGKLWAGIVVMLIAFIALAALVNNAISGIEFLGEPLTLERILGFVFAPLVWLAGIPWDEAGAAGQLMGIKTILNEVIAYSTLAELPADTLDDRSTLIMIYALCGFANISSLGIVIGGLSAIEPSRRPDILSLTPKALISGTLATLSSGAAIGLVY